MELKTAIYYRNAYVHYRIKRENKRVYHADLVAFEGSPEDMPSSSLSLMRGFHQWWGSVDDNQLINSIGAAINTLAEKE